MNTPESDPPIRQDVQSIRSLDEPSDPSEPTPRQSKPPKLRKPPRLWPGVITAVLLVLLRFVVPAVAPDVLVFGLPLFLIGLLGAFICALLIILWWLFFSRLPWAERLGAIALIIFTMFITYRLVHESIRGGAMGNLLFVLSIPIFCLALVVWAVFSQRLSHWPRRAALAGVIFLVGLGFLP